MLPRYSDIKELIKNGSSAEVQEKVMELREAALLLQEENFELKEQVRQLQEKLKEKSTFVYQDPFYWYINGNDKVGPFCQQCYENSAKKIRLQYSGNDYWSCFTCNQDFTDKDHHLMDLEEITNILHHR